ncbi:MAG: ImmA/IrrE family metallo-endopeptidase [Candidatus Thorarchaeota archaeon]
MPSVKANITPEVIKWARESAGFSPEDAAKKIGRPVDDINAWEAGEKKPTIPQARNASKVYKRPLAVFFLPHPPKDFSTLRDFRKLPSNCPREFSTNLRFLVRQTHERQVWLSEYLREEGYPPVEGVGSASVSNKPLALAENIRNALGITYEDIRHCGSRGEALKVWIDASEELGIFVFQSGNMQYEKIEIEEARGFALADEYAPFIFLNAQDAKVAQIFTLAHEIAHLWINESGVSNLYDRGRALAGADEIEVFCNSVAAEVILPQKDFSELWKTLDETEPLEDRIERGSRRFKVSKTVIARRLLNLNSINQRRYLQLADQFYQEWLEHKDRQKKKNASSEGGPHPYLMRVINNGRHFSRVVLGAYQSGRLSGRDTSNILGVKLNALPKYANYAGMKISKGRAFE